MGLHGASGAIHEAKQFSVGSAGSQEVCIYVVSKAFQGAPGYLRLF